MCDQIEDNEVGRADDMHGGEEKSIRNLVGKLERRRPL
jgi:hypothetical protein